MALSLARQTSYCFYCPKMCHFSCPVAITSARESHHPGWLMTFFKMAREEKKKWEEVASLFYACSGCYRCQEYCRHGNDLPAVMEEARREAFQRGLYPRSLQEKIQQAPKLSKEAEKPASPGSVVLFPSCFPEDQGELERLQRLMKNLVPKKNFHFPTSQLCCGSSFLALGDEGGFADYSTELQNRYPSASELVAPSLECVKTLKKIFPSFPPVTFYLDYLSREGKVLSPSSPLTLEGPILFYQSPLESRWGGRDGRKWLKSLFPEVEFLPSPWEGKDSRCSGMAFGLERSHPRIAAEMATSLLRDAAALGAKGILVSCMNIRQHLKKQGILPVFSPEELLEKGIP